MLSSTRGTSCLPFPLSQGWFALDESIKAFTNSVRQHIICYRVVHRCGYIYFCFIDCGGNIGLWKSQVIFVMALLAGV